MNLYMIVVGDCTDHGGVVLSGSGNRLIDGKAIARIGDQVSCPRHGTNKIVEGHPTFTIDGKAAALTGCKTECGSVLLGINSATVCH
ncbi:PAAR domain-containing protein [Collimonas silvisoli]|uniref:PAAR domain-containing protein n=1 Tax=Collimonas silvisoli TaxID=2825884 RepID=UPI001B8B1EF5|nr:PAAR domain-containing protein [Collimonas silvisoli]